MIVALEVPFTDAAASQLGFLPAAPALPVLSVLERPDLVPDGHVSLRLLGASHQAVLSLPGGSYAETVACAATVDGALPTTRATTVGDWHCRLRVSVVECSTDQLAADCRRMRRCAAEEDPHHSLYASFPGHPLAVTFLRVRPATVDTTSGSTAGWSTVHVYPESGQQVLTRTDLHPVVQTRTTSAVAGPAVAAREAV